MKQQQKFKSLVCTPGKVLSNSQTLRELFLILSKSKASAKTIFPECTCMVCGQRRSESLKSPEPGQLSSEGKRLKPRFVMPKRERKPKHPFKAKSLKEWRMFAYTHGSRRKQSEVVQHSLFEERRLSCFIGGGL